MLNIKPLESDETKKVSEENKIPFSEKDKHGNIVFKDLLFEAMKKVIKEDLNAIRNGILVSQYGSRITFYQGNPSNFWGFVEITNGDKLSDIIKPIYNIRIYSSILKKIFKKNDLTKEFFEGII